MRINHVSNYDLDPPQLVAILEQIDMGFFKLELGYERE